jgi:hypothetical protein
LSSYLLFPSTPARQRELAARLFDDLLTDTVLAIDRVATRKLWRAQI